MSDLSDTLFSTPEMTALFSGSTFVQHMLDVEAALAQAEAAAGVIPKPAADVIAAQCRAEHIDLPALFEDAARAGTPAIPLVLRLTDLVKGDARGFVHWGATSQDIVDTATVLQMKEGLMLLARGLHEVAAACAALAAAHRSTPMAGRTLLQHAVPITFGLKAARWLAMTVRVMTRVTEVRSRACVVQLGGAAGTLAALGDRGVRVMDGLAERLRLAAPELPWHTERDRMVEIAFAVGAAAGAMGKIATDVVLLSQTEVGEVSPSAPGPSSAMPQKRNPVDAINAVACARAALAQVPAVLSSMIQEHERAAGAWQAEGQAVPALFRAAAGAVHWCHRAVGGLKVDAGRMRANLEQTHGLIMAEALTTALAVKVGRDEAFAIVRRLSDRIAGGAGSLRAAIAGDGRIREILTDVEIDQALDAAGYQGSAEAFIDRALGAFRDSTQPSTESR